MPVKSFRAAAERIVRQESATPTDVVHLLGSAVRPARAIVGEQAEWAGRLEALASLGDYDALGIVASSPQRLEQWLNIGEPSAVHEAVVEARAEAARRGAAMQLRASIALADGRLSTEIMVAPLGAVEGVEGWLLALRVGRGFSATDAVTATNVGALLALEVHRAAGSAQDVRTVHQSLALYELARIGMRSEELSERLAAMVELVASSLQHDLAQLWLLRGGGSLRLRAAHPTESLVLEIARPRDHAGLARALDGESSRVTGPSLRSWIRRTARELIIAPLQDGDGVSGLLILGRWNAGYADDDLRLATQCAEFFARIMAAEALTRRDRAAIPHADTHIDETEGLTGS